MPLLSAQQERGCENRQMPTAPSGVHGELWTAAHELTKLEGRGEKGLGSWLAGTRSLLPPQYCPKGRRLTRGGTLPRRPAALCEGRGDSPPVLSPMFLSRCPEGS